MPATNMAPVSLSSSLSSVFMYNVGCSPRLLTASFHIVLLHTLRRSPQTITQLFCLKVRLLFAVNALAACIKVMGICYLLSCQEIIGSGTGISLTCSLFIPPKAAVKDTI